MTVAPDGRLFVACAGDNTVHVIPTKIMENPGADPSPARRLWEGSREIISTSLLSVRTIIEGEFQAVTDGMVGGDLPVEAGRD
jgi:hypothetical protein